MKPATKFIGRKNPFTGESTVLETVYMNPQELKISDDEMPAGRVSIANKYEPIFGKMKYGQCVICQPVDVGKVAGAMRKYLSKGKGGKVRTVRHYPFDRLGRVWMMRP